jgi:hypothetical protein
MAKAIKIGQQDYTITVFIPDPASTDGSGKTGLVAANLTVSYTRVETDNDVTVTDVTSSLSDLSALTDSHADWGLKEVSSTLAPGLYRLDIADAVFATGAWSAVVYVMITSSAAAASPIEFVMVPELPYDGVKAASITNNAITAAAINADAITAAKIADGAITNAKVADDVDVNVKTITNGAITAAAIADAAIDNATFAADVGSTAYATNIIALAAKKAVDEYDPPTKAELDTAQGAVVVSAAGIDAIFDRASSLTLSFEALITRIYQILNNAMTVDESSGAISLKAIGGASEIATGDVDSAAGVTDRDELTWA